MSLDKNKAVADSRTPSRFSRDPYAKDHVPCRFCGKVVAIRIKLGRSAYKAQHYAHKCEHGNECLSSRPHCNSNWPAIFLGGQVVHGCAICYRDAQIKYNETHGREIYKIKSV